MMRRCSCGDYFVAYRTRVNGRTRWARWCWQCDGRPSLNPERPQAEEVGLDQGEEECVT